jgi:hypothetical protein
VRISWRLRVLVHIEAGVDWSIETIAGVVRVRPGSHIGVCGRQPRESGNNAHWKTGKWGFVMGDREIKRGRSTQIGCLVRSRSKFPSVR